MVAIKLQFGEDIRRLVLDDGLPVAEQFAALTARVVELYPQLQGRLRLTWRDEEGDAISVTTVADFQEALTAHRRSEASALRLVASAVRTDVNNNNNNNNNNNAAPTAVPTATATPPPAAAAPAPAPAPAPEYAEEEAETSADEAERDMGPAVYNERGERVHPYITCDGCQGPVAGVRYKCSQCHDFDLCESCEAAEGHPRHHVLLKIRVPQRVMVWTPYARHGHGAGHHRGGGGWWRGQRGPAGFGGRGGACGGGGCGAGYGGCGPAFERRAAWWASHGDPSKSPSPAPAPAPGAAPAAAASSSTRASPAPAAPNFDEQLRILHEMGFVDDAVNFQLLQSRLGRLEDVIARLTQLNMGPHF